jgi:hypothetical protein
MCRTFAPTAHGFIGGVKVARRVSFGGFVVTMSRRNTDPTARKPDDTPRRVKKTDAGSTMRDVAQESAAIYPDTFDTPPSPDEIAAEAYCIYCERGHEDGRDMDHWLEAERRLSVRRMSQAGETERDHEGLRLQG